MWRGSWNVRCGVPGHELVGLRQSGVSRACRRCASHCPDGVDLDQGVPLFTLKDLNATVQGDDDYARVVSTCSGFGGGGSSTRIFRRRGGADGHSGGDAAGERPVPPGHAHGSPCGPGRGGLHDPRRRRRWRSCALLATAGRRGCPPPSASDIPRRDGGRQQAALTSLLRMTFDDPVLRPRRSCSWHATSPMTSRRLRGRSRADPAFAPMLLARPRF